MLSLLSNDIYKLVYREITTCHGLDTLRIIRCEILTQYSCQNSLWPHWYVTIHLSKKLTKAGQKMTFENLNHFETNLVCILLIIVIKQGFFRKETSRLLNLLY